MNKAGSASQQYDMIYDCVIIGAGAAGLFYAGLGDHPSGQNLLILEKTSRPGQKLLISGSGMCNITHGGSIKEFIGKYGDNGKLIRKCLYSHNNIDLVKKLESSGIKTMERADGKIFPASLKSKDVLDMLLDKAKSAGWKLKCDSEVTQIEILLPSSDVYDGSDGSTDISVKAVERDDAAATPIIQLTVKDTLRADSQIQKIKTKKLIIACGGAAYPATGSDGTFFSVMRRDLKLKIVTPVPALAPVYVQNYPYSNLSGIGFDIASVSCMDEKAKPRIAEGPMLLTHKGFSGPAMLHISQYVRPGTEIYVNYLPKVNPQTLTERIRSGRKGNTAGAANFVTGITGLPKAFLHQLLKESSTLPDKGVPKQKNNTGTGRNILNKKAADLSNKDVDDIIRSLTCHPYSVSGIGGFNDAMVTAGGVSLQQIDLQNMQIKNSILSSEKNAACNEAPAPDIRIIGEALDICGETGGYNLQFAYSSAMAALSPSR